MKLENMLGSLKRGAVSLGLSLALTVGAGYGCGDTNNYYGDEENTGKGSSEVKSFCQQICAQPGCAGDLELSSGSGCVDECITLASGYSPSYLEDVKFCFNNYDCDGDNSWIYCLKTL